MRNLFNNLKLAFSASARNALANSLYAEDQAADKAHAAVERKHREITGALNAEREPLVGHFSTTDLHNLSSDYAQSAIAQLGTWSAIARGFTEFVKNPKSEVLDPLLGEFHAWNAALTEDKQMDDEATLLVIARLSQVKPAKGNKDTDAIIARVTKKSVAEVQADRVAKAEIKSKQREEAMLNFNSLLWSSVYGEAFAEMPAQKVYDKLEQTLLWIASWDSSNPAAQAAELLLIEQDMKLVASIAKRSDGATEDFAEGVMTADALTRRMA